MFLRKFGGVKFYVSRIENHDKQAVCNYFIGGTTVALRFWLLTN